MSTKHILNIATRQSPLALWQAEHIKTRLLSLFPHLQINLVTFVTQGDKILDVPLAKIGGKGLFVKELEHALLERRADIAVHSMKDVPMNLPDGLSLPIICEREDPSDAFVSPTFTHINELPIGATVGTSSLRRRCQLQAMRPDLKILDLRGNVGTRLNKLDDGQYDAIILASAGLKRLGLTERIRHALDMKLCLPAVGQGALGIECRADDYAILELLRPLHDEQTACCVQAERAMNHRLMGGCQVPIAGFAQFSNQNNLQLEGRVGSLDGHLLLKSVHTAPVKQAVQLGHYVAESLLAQGAGQLLAQLEP